MTAIGQRVGRYELVAPLGTGAAGEVWEAVLHGPQGFRKPVALKLLRESRSPVQVRGLLREARLGALLSHPHVVGIHEVGQAEDQWYVSMELVRGRTLGTLITGPRLPVSAIVEIGVQAASALAHVHALVVDGRPAGLVHRDVKPANLMIDRGGMVKLVDLGIARLGGGEREIAGTAGYMAPEQLLGEEDNRADLFALGATLFHLAARRTPFGRGDAAIEAIRQVDATTAAGDFFQPIEAVLPGLADVIRRCLQGDPARRWPTADALGEALIALRRTAGPAVSLAQLAVHGRATEASDVSSSRGSTDSATAVLAPGNLVRPGTALVGREDERRDLLGRIRAGDRLVTLTGPGGMGKTSLASHVAWDLRHALPGGAWFCSLADARTAADVCAALARALGAPLGGDPVVQLGHALAARGHALVVLDNLEQVAVPAAELVARWLAAAPEIAFLATSQVALRLVDERRISLGALAPDQGRALFVHRAPRPIDPADFPLVDAIVAQVDGLPLAIELAAARTRMLSLKSLVSHLDDRLRVLAGGETDRPARQRSLRASLDASTQLLPPWGAGALGQLSVFVGGFTLDAADAVLDLTAWPDAPWALDVLTLLVEHSLVVAGANERFHLLAVVAEHAAGSLDPRAARSRHARWYAQLGDREALDLAAYQGGAPVAALLTELGNLTAATEHAIQSGDGETAARTALAAAMALDLRGPAHEGAHLLARAAAVPGAEPLAAQLAVAEARLWVHIGSVAEARSALERARRLPMSDRVKSSLAAHTGALYARQGAPTEARAAYGEAIALAAALGDRYREAHAKVGLANVLRQTADRDGAERLYGEALAVFRIGGARLALSSTLLSLANLHHLRCDWDAAIEALDTVLKLARQEEDRRGEATALGNRGMVLRDMGRLPEARASVLQAIDVQRNIGNVRGEANALLHLGPILEHLGEPAEAEAMLRQALAVNHQFGDLRTEGHALDALGNVLQGRGAYEEALALHLEASEIQAKASDVRAEAVAWVNAGCALRELGRYPEAAAAFEQAAILAEQGGDLQVAGANGHERTALLQRMGDLAGARAAITRSEALLREQNDKLELGKALARRGSLDRASGRDRDADAAFAEARKLAREAGMTAHTPLFRLLDALDPGGRDLG